MLNQESQIWDGFLAWQQFASNFLSENEAPSPKKVRELIVEGSQLEKSHSDIQLAEFFKSRKLYLERVASREPEQGPPIIAELQKLFRDPLVGKLWIVEVKRGDGAPYHYYSRREPERKEGKVRVSYLAGFNLEEKNEPIPEADVTYLERAPQSIIAERASDLLNNMSSRDWEKNFTSVLNSVMKEEHLDPILRITLLQRVLKIAATGSSATF